MSALLLNQRHGQSLSPQLQHAVRLLQMSSLEFGTVVRDELDKNPFLETEEGEGDDPEGLPGQDQDQARDLDHDQDHDSSGEIDSDSELWLDDGSVGSRGGVAGEISALDMTPVETPLNAHWHGQLNLCPWSIARTSERWRRPF